MIEIRDTLPEDIDAIAADMREMDACELQRMLFRAPLGGLRFIKDISNSCKTILFDGKPHVIFGYMVTDALFSIASPFMVATKWAEEHPATMARLSRKDVVMKEFYGFFLRNWVIPSNTLAIRWLGWLGFYVHPEQDGLRMFIKDCR